MAKEVDPKKLVIKQAEKLKKDTFAIIWVIFIAVLLVMTAFFKQYVKGMIVISILFIVFWYFEPMMLGVTGKTVTTFLSRGHKVPRWKRFPLFFLAIIMVYVIYVAMELLLDFAFPEASVNIIFVAIWVALLYVLWTYKFSKET